MRIVMFCHAVRSCWNNGNAHFQRGVARALTARGHAVTVWEPLDGWSRRNLSDMGGSGAIALSAEGARDIDVRLYAETRFDADEALDGADLALVHEWTDEAVVAALSRRRAAGGRTRLLFHDTHHRAVSAQEAVARLDLSAFDAVLAFGASLAEVYRRQGWGRRAQIWHEAADTTVFHPLPHTDEAPPDDLVFIGNWGEGERAAELRAFLVEPVQRLSLAAAVHGVRWPAQATAQARAAGIAVRGWLPNHKAPRVFAHARTTVHVPRRPYVRQLPGIPTIRVFEALACGIPLVSAPWDDAEGLFRIGTDLLMVRDTASMAKALRDLLADPQRAGEQAAAGLARVRERHTCRHRADELLALAASLGIAGAVTGTPVSESAPVPVPPLPPPPVREAPMGEAAA